MKIPGLSFALALAGALVAGAFIFAGTVAGCDRSGALGTLDAALEGGCPTCPPDPNRNVVADCTQALGIDTLPIETFNNHSNSAGVGGAEDLYKYTDGTSVLLFEDFYHDGTGEAGFEPAVVTPDDLCTPPARANGVLHMFGGPFLSWGGGIGIAMQKLNGRDPGNGGNGVDLSQATNMDPAAPKGFCCTNKPSTGPCQITTDPKFAATCPPSSAEFAVYVGALDVSGFQGVSFWARRGYTGQAGIRINVGDKYTDDDLNYLAQRQQEDTGQPQPLHCQRVRECACRNHQNCALESGKQLSELASASGTLLPPLLAANGGLFCGALPFPTDLSQGCVGLNGGPTLCCETTACDAPYPAFPGDTIPGDAMVPGRPPPWSDAGDPQFYGRPCTPYAWPNGIGSTWCFDPARDPPPAAPTQQCGDHWESVVTLDTDWHFYKVPFTDMHQQGFAQKSEQLDLHSVSVVRFTWDVGYVDDWIDDVSFYRASM